MPQAYITSPKRGHDSPPGPGRSPRTRRSGRSSRLTSPIPLSPKELADYILERGNNATSPIIAKVVLDQHLDGRALAEFADESDSEDRLGSFSLLQDRQLADDFLRTTSTLRHKFPSPEITRSTRPSLKEIALLLEKAEVASHSPASTGPAYMTPPQLSPSIPEWDLEDPWTPEDMEIFAPTQDSVDDSESDLLFSPGLRNFRHPATSSSESLRGAYSSLLRPVPPFTPENMPLLSALDMRHAPYGISPSSSQGGDVGLGDFPANTQGSLPNRQASPGDVRGGNPQTRTVAENGGLSAPRMSRSSSKRSTFEDSILRTYSPRSSSCPPRAIRPQIVIPDSFWQLPSQPQRQYAEAEIQTDEQVPEAQLTTPQAAGFTSDAEDPAFYDAKSSRSVTESVRDMDEGNDDFGDFVDIPQPGEEERTSTHDTPKPPPIPELQPDAPTPHASTPVVSATTLPAPIAAVQRVKAEHKMSSTSPTSSPPARTTSEPQKESSKKGQNRPSVDLKLAQSSAGSSRSHAPSSAPPRPAPSLQQSKQLKEQKPPRSDRPAYKSAGSSSRTSHTPAVKKTTEEKEKQRNTTTKRAQSSPSPAQSRQSSWPARVATSPAKPLVTKPDQATDKAVSESKDKNATKQDVTPEQSKTQPEVSSVPVDLTEGTGDVDASGDQSTKPIVAAELTIVDAVVSVNTATIELHQDEVSNVAADVEAAESISLAPPKEPTSSIQTTTNATFDSGDTLANSPEVERLPSSDGSAPKPDTTAPTLLVTTTSGAGETTSTNELSSEAQESLESALSSSVIAETKSSGASSMTEAEKELKPEPEQSSTPANKVDVTVEPSFDSSMPPRDQSSTATPAIPDPLPPQEKPADDSEPSTSQSAPSTETTLRVDVSPGLDSERETAEGFVNVESQLPDVPEQFESIDRNEVAGADEQATREDCFENPWDDAQAHASEETVATAAVMSAELNLESKDTDTAPSKPSTEDVGQQEQVPKDVAPARPEGGRTKTTNSGALGEGVNAKLASLEDTEKSLVDPLAPDTSAQSRQVIESVGGSRPTSPAVARVCATGKLEQTASQTTDLQTDDGEESNGEALAADAQKLTKNQKKRAAKRLKKQQKSGAEKAVEGAIAQGSGQGDAEKKKLEEEERMRQKKEEEERKRVEEEERKKAEEEERKKAEEEERKKAEEKERKRAEEKEKKRLAEEAAKHANLLAAQMAKEAQEAETDQRIRQNRQRDHRGQQQWPQISTQVSEFSLLGRTPGELERGKTPMTPSPIQRATRPFDIENARPPESIRRQQTASPASSHSSLVGALSKGANFFKGAFSGS